MITVLSPAGREPARASTPLVDRLSALRGARLGLLDNSKKNADALLQAIGGRLERGHGMNVRLWQKGKGTGAAGAAPDQTLREMAYSCDAVLVALGD